MDFYCLFTVSLSSVFITMDFESVEAFKVSKFEDIVNIELRDYLLSGSGFQKIRVEKFSFSLVETYQFVEFIVNCVVHFGKVYTDHFHIRDIIHWSAHMKWKEQYADDVSSIDVSGLVSRPRFHTLLGLRAYSGRMEDTVSENIFASLES